MTVHNVFKQRHYDVQIPECSFRLYLFKNKNFNFHDLILIKKFGNIPYNARPLTKCFFFFCYTNFSKVWWCWRQSDITAQRDSIKKVPLLYFLIVWELWPEPHKDNTIAIDDTTTVKKKLYLHIMSYKFVYITYSSWWFNQNVNEHVTLLKPRHRPKKKSYYIVG